MKKYKNITTLLGLPTFEYEKFHEKTKITKLARNSNSKFWPEEWKTTYYRGYARFPEVELPKPILPESVSLKKTLLNRRSIREFSKGKIELSDISNLLHYSAGISLDNANPSKNKRFYPSPGARYPLEVYLISLNSELPKAIYHYYVKNNTLERICDFNKKDLGELTHVPFAKNASVLIVITAVFRRNAIKYGERGYRHVLVEAGHLAQNFYLLSSALDLGICGIGGYIDDNVNALFDVDGVKESVIYMLGVGKNKK